jgi:helicase
MDAQPAVGFPENPARPAGLVPTSEFPAIRYKFSHFNPPQSEFWRRGRGRDANAVVAANTSAGKTVIAEMAIQAALDAGRCALYLSPLRALTSEKHGDWTDPNHSWSARRISIVTGDYQLTERRKAELDAAEIVALTSEMLDSRVKKHRSEKSAFLLRAGVVVVDEAHLLGSEGRGAAVENALMGFSRLNPSCRLVLLSATMPNVAQIADWVRSLNGKDTVLIESDYRPCKLTVHFERFQDGHSYQQDQDELVRKAAHVVRMNRPDKFIAFVHTKKAGRDMKEALERGGLKAEFHSADLDRGERQDIETRFRGRELDVVVATSTLCLHPDTTVVTKTGPKRIAEVERGEEVLTHKGEFRKVLGTSARTYSGQLMEVKAAGRLPVLMTPEHRVLRVWRRKTGYHGKHGAWQYWVRSQPEWAEARRLHVGDEVLHPAVKSQPMSVTLHIHDKEFVGSNQHGSEFPHPYAVRVPKTLELDEELCELLGLFVAEGYTGKNGVVGFAIATYEDDLTSLICRVLDSRFKVKIRVNNFSRHRRTIICCSRVLAGFFSTTFGRRAENKRFPEFFLSLDDRLLSALVRGAWRGDGGVYPQRACVASYATVSQVLAEQMYQALLKLGYVSHLDVRAPQKPKEGKPLLILGKRPQYHLRLSGQSGRKFCGDVFGMDPSCFKTGNREYDTMNLIRGNAHLPVRSITPVQYSGQVHNLHVEGDESYVTQFVVHNSMGLNLPARRVVVLGTKRGQQDVSWLDIRQMCGRAGRVGLDPQGDAHIVVPESKFLTSQEEYEHLPPVKSCLFDRDALAFHVIAEIDSGAIGSPKEMLLWHSRSLAHLQGQTLGLKDAEALLAELAKWGLVDTSRRPVETTSLGKVAALTYYSPFDIASWAMNFRKAFKDDPSDLVTAWALSDIPSVRRTGYVAADIAKEAFDLKNALYERGYDLPQGSLAAALAYLRLLRGDAERHSDSLSPVVRQCRGDAERIALALKLIDAKHGHWGRQTWFDEMALRVRYGVTPEAAVFCRLDGVGAVRAKALAAAGFQSVTDLLRDPGRVLGILKGKTGHSVLAQAARAVGGPPMS